MAAGACALIGLIGYGIGASFWPFLIAEVILAVGTSLTSGTGHAMAFDVLAEEGREDEYRDVAGHMHAVALASDAIAGLIGGLIAVHDLRAAIWCTAVLAGSGIAIAWTMREPSRHAPADGSSVRQLWRICRETLIRRADLRSIIVLGGIGSTLTLSLVWLTQPYQQLVGLPLALFDVTHGVIMLGSAAIATQVPRLTRRFSDKQLLIAVLAGIIASYAALGATTTLWGITFLFTGRVLWGALKPLTTDIIKKMTSSSGRATGLSLPALAGRLMFALAALPLGYAADVLSIAQAIWLAGAIAAFFVTVVLIAMHDVWERLPA
jgi:hypothetical protein